MTIHLIANEPVLMTKYTILDLHGATFTCDFIALCSALEASETEPGLLATFSLCPFPFFIIGLPTSQNQCTGLL
jgi:hypothetical protein